MNEPTPTQRRLAARLRELRQSSLLGSMTQKQLAEALAASTPLISSWESAKEIPPENRLQAYGRLFATPRSRDGERMSLVPAEDLTTEERHRMEALVDELVDLRDEAQHQVQHARRETGALGGGFWYFPDRQSITILCTPLSDRQLGYDSSGGLPPEAPPIIAYSRPSHPNHIGSLRNGDIDALIELVGHIRAENPTAEVRWTTFDSISDDQFTGHLVILGNASPPTGEINLFEDFVQRLELPLLARLPEGADEEFDTEFVVNIDDDDEPTFAGSHEEVYRPRFLRADSASPDRPRVTIDDAPQLEYDVALIARKANPLNLSATITVCTGVFSRGTYGAVRTFTDANLRTRNERFLEEHFADINDFWILLQVPVYGGEKTITPDLERPVHRIRSSP